MSASAAAPVPSSLLGQQERVALGSLLTLAMMSGALLVVALITQWLSPDRADVAQLIAGLSALLIAIPILTRAAQALHNPSLDGLTDLLVACALLAAWVAGDLITAAIVPLSMVIGHILEERSLLGTQEAIAALERLHGGDARKVAADGSEYDCPVGELQAGDQVRILPGDRVPTDVKVITGSASIDTAAITGESLPRMCEPGTHLYAGSLNLDGTLVAEVEQAAEDSTLSRIVNLLQEAESSKPAVTRVLEKYAGIYLPMVLMGSTICFFVTGSMNTAMAVLIAACPCALALAAPSTAVAALASASRHGILCKGTAFLEQVVHLDSLIIDKTGTITKGALHVADRQLESDWQEADADRLAASLARNSQHPASRAIAHVATETDQLADIHEERGCGMTGLLGDRTVRLGRPSWLRTMGVHYGELPTHNGPIVGLSCDNQLLAWYKLADELRPETEQALQDLRDCGLNHHCLLTGDRQEVAKPLGEQLAFDEIRADVLPEGKLSCVEESRQQGRMPLVVGDGINDALALKSGAVGVAMGESGTAVALASADMVLLSDDLKRLPTLIRLARRAHRTVSVNVALALVASVVTLILAASGTFGPLATSLLHNIGTIAVLLNAGRLLHFQEP